MLFEPGPIPVLTPDFSPLGPEPPEFLALATDAMSELPALEDWMDGFLADALNLPDPPELADYDVFLQAADAGLTDVLQFPIDLHTTNTEGNSLLMHDRLNQALGDAPAEIWDPVPPPANFPADSGPQPGVNGPTFLSIQNVTRPGDNSYYAGDSYTITVQIQSGGGNYAFGNVKVYIVETHDGVQLAPIDTGGTNTFGVAHYSGTFYAPDVGSWRATTSPPGAGAPPSLAWAVNPGVPPGGPGGPPTYGGPITVTLQNLSSYDPFNFHVGDSWILTVTGGANQPVYINAVQNGLDLGTQYLGNTSSTGILSVFGTMDPTTPGTWVESYNVGGTLWQGQLRFTVT